jgi:uroporphyrinogen decarboxylase
VLSTAAYREFSLAYQARVVARLAASAAARELPLIAFTKGGGQWLPEQAGIGAAALGVDWTQELGAVRAATGGRVALQGNLDPIALFAPPERIRAEVARVLDSYGRGPGHVFNLGHGVLQQTDPEHVRVLVDAVHELSAAYHV